mgnify:CR=1 FL=1
MWHAREDQNVKKEDLNDIVINKKNAIHNRDSFQQFCISTGATKLFEPILNSETTTLH